MPPRTQRGGVVPDESEEGRVHGEVQAGLRCYGCKRRLGKVAFEFTKVEVVKPLHDLKGDRAVGVSTMVACGRPDCGYALECAKEATAVTRLERPYLFLDVPGVAELFDVKLDEKKEAADGGGGD